MTLGLFAKYWEPGKVKTRLAASLGEEKAASVYLTFLKTLLERFGSTHSAKAERVVAYSPENRGQEFRELFGFVQANSPWTLQPQSDGDLGDRLQRFFASRFEAGDAKVAVIGTDSPTLPASFVHQANWLLDGHDVVLGPTEDGGYYLVAAKMKVPPIFTEIDWSTERVWEQTIAKLQENRVSFAVLPTWYDVDNIDDLGRLRSEIAAAIQHSTAATFERPDQYSVADRLSKQLRQILDV